MPPWKKVKLGDVIKINEKSIGKDFQFSNIEYLDTSSVTENRFEKPELLGLVNSPSRAKRIVRTGDTLISTVRPNLKHFGFVKNAKSNTIASTGFAVLTPYDIEPYYLFCFIAQDSITNYLSSIADSSTTTFPAFNPNIIEDLELNIPDLPTQSRIASILSAFDDKIELNRQMNNTLGEMAQTLYKKYFVAGIDPDNLPEGWRFGKIGELIEVSKTTISPSIFPEKIFLHYSIPAFDINKMASKESGLSILSNKFIVKSNSILFSKLNPRFPRVWMIGEVDEKTAICSTEFLVIKPIIDNWYSFIYLTLCSNILIDSLTSIATGTSGSHQRIRLDDILQTEIIIPSETDSYLFERNVRPNLKRIIQNNFESEILKSLRDNLLPKLMNGEIPVDSVSLLENPETIVA